MLKLGQRGEGKDLDLTGVGSSQERWTEDTDKCTGRRQWKETKPAKI